MIDGERNEGENGASAQIIGKEKTFFFLQHPQLLDLHSYYMEEDYICRLVGRNG